MMRIPMKINNEPILAECDGDEFLMSLLRKRTLHSVKCGCNKGLCGSCTVLMDGKPVPSCLIPAVGAQGRNIITLEYFSTTEEYNDIIKGFEHVGLSVCGFCNAGKIFVAHEIIEAGQRPNRNNIIEYTKTFNCMCTHQDLLINGIIFASDIRRNRLWGEKHAIR